MRCFEWILLGCLGVAPGMVAAADAVVPDASTAWRDFLAKGTADDVNAAISAIDAVGYDGEGVDAAKCRESAAKLASARDRVRVSIVLQRAALLCAESTGDGAAAEDANRWLAALARHALAESDRGAWPRPVRIVLPGDAPAFFASAGMVVRYEMFMQYHPSPYFPFVVAAAPRDGGTEKLLRFDYIDTLAQVDRGARAHGTPRLAMSYVEAFLGNSAKHGAVSAIDYQAFFAASRESTPAAKVAAVRDAAGMGGIGSAITWLMVCGSSKEKGCAVGLVDALLPAAEKRHAYPMMLLALAYAEGIGVPRNPQAATAMLDAADRAWDRRGASVVYAELLEALHPDDPMPAEIATRLRESAGAGNATAAAMLVSMRMEGEKGYVLGAEDEALLASPDNNGTGQGFLKLAGWYEDRDAAKSRVYLERAAAANNPDALRRLAIQLRESQGSKPPSQEALAWLERAGNGGDLYSMYYSGYQAFRQGKLQRAEDWLLPAAMRGDGDAMFFLASLWDEGHEGLEGDAKRAIAVYESLQDSKEYGPRARRALADMALAGRGMQKDPAKARKWVEHDAQAGDVDSQLWLAGNLLYGRDGLQDEVAGRRWMDRAIAGGSTEAMDQYGLWLHNRGKSDADRKRGVALSRKAAASGGVGEMNNAAWMLCVSPYDIVRDPPEGMALARKIEATPDITPGTLDTVAACLAATGDYARAAEVQARVIAEMERYARPDKENIAEMAERLALYKAGKPYIEPVAAHAGN